MIIGWPAQNLFFGGARFRFEYTVSTGTFQAGEIITGGTSSAKARIERVDTTALVILAISRSGTFTEGETITGATSTATGTINTNTLTTHATSRSALLTSTSTPASGFVEDLQNYLLAQTCSFTVNTTAQIDIDRGASWSAGTRTIGDPKAILISGFVDGSYNYLANTTSLTSITVQSDDNSSFTSPTTLATLTAGSPTYGPKAFGYGQLFIEFAALTERYIRILFTSASSMTVTMGNIWIGSTTDSLADEDWNFKNGWSITAIDRSDRTQTMNGGYAVRPLPSTRRLELESSWNIESFHLLLDMFQGQYSAYGEAGAPVMLCLDPDNNARAVTGQHLFSGLWLSDTSIAATDSVARNGSVYFLPDIAMRFTEWRG